MLQRGSTCGAPRAHTRPPPNCRLIHAQCCTVIHEINVSPRLCRSRACRVRSYLHVLITRTMRDEVFGSVCEMVDMMSLWFLAFALFPLACHTTSYRQGFYPFHPRFPSFCFGNAYLLCVCIFPSFAHVMNALSTPQEPVTLGCTPLLL